MRRLLRAPSLCVVVVLCATTTRAEPVMIPAADPLAAARAAMADGRLDEAVALAASAPGLLGHALAAKGDEKAACELYERERAAATLPASAAALRVARCRARTGDHAGALAAWVEVGASPLGREPSVLAELAAFTDTRALAPPASLEKALEVAVGPFDAADRDSLARALDVLKRRSRGVIAERAAARLRDELFDTAVGAKVEAPVFTEVEQALSRARLLDAAHDSAGVTALLTPLLAERDASPAACEARLLIGRAQRKLRKYAAARKQLARVAATCSDDTKKRAAFLEARVALLSKAASAVSLGDKFVAAWPNDALTDDVLFLLGEAHEQAGRDDDARAVWQRIVDEHADGDQAHDARFRLAFMLARRADQSGAIAMLDDAARRAGDRVDVLDRALYWRARLRVFPRAGSLEPSSDARARDEGLAGLRALATARPASFYGHLARLLVLEQLDDKKRAEALAGELAPLGSMRAHAGTARLTLSPALLADGGFVLSRAFADAGFDEEAAILLTRIDATRLGPDDLVAVALLLGRVGSPGAGHALLRKRGRALLPGRPGADTALAWSVGWPRAYAAAIEPAADDAKVPRAMLFGLAREESAFDAEVVSWAGAVGLCQLMPPTADDEARALGLAPPSIDALRTPALNARLGAAHLGRRLHGMRHPLLAIAAYNAGPGAVARWNPHGPLDLWVEQIPVEETRNYVKKVTGSWVSYSVLDGSADDVRFSLVLR